MPLSDEEMRLLEQMERALSEEDPKFASALRGSPISRATRGRVLGSAVGFIAGIAVLMAGAVTQRTWLGIIGFVLMLAAATIGLSAWRARGPEGVSHEAPTESIEWAASDGPSGFSVIEGGKKQRRPRNQSKPAGGFMQRMEHRWQRRRDERGGL